MWVCVGVFECAWEGVCVGTVCRQGVYVSKHGS